ncbi:prohibitin family protein [Leptolyngbya sp. FACHB-36]|uniref:prohibitin family protein n=1 Tax=Leptolyngbya sp. FACHB-36 TaxID=2692808 RepID=UPI00168199B5|nr:prohibitin family protein [Leptolyngbya sp. FACHB-36]MBD2022050.1 prohibitin family protein [Leptolyngbya sp. FACHB-36]
MRSARTLSVASQLTLVILLVMLLSASFAVVSAGNRGVLMQFGSVQDTVLGEGIHPIIPLVNTVKSLSVRVQEQEISAEASSKDLQEVFTDVALNWHIIPQEANAIFQQIGDEVAIIDHIIDPAVEEVLKAVMAQYTAEEIITKRGAVKAAVDDQLKLRLANYHIDVDDISLVHVRFSQRFRDAVEAKQVAEQDAKRAEFLAQRAMREAEAKVNLAKGEAEAQRLIRETLTPELIQKQAVDRWNGNLPLFVGEGSLKLIDLNKLIDSNSSSVFSVKK